MAPRAFLLCVCFTLGLLADRSQDVVGLDIGLFFSVEPQDVTVVRSKATQFDCGVESTLGPVNITWTHDGVPMELASNNSRRVLLTNGTLLIRKVVTKKLAPNDGPDLGRYRCVVTTPVNIGLVSRAAHLRGAALSHDFTESPTDLTTGEGSTVRFACQIESIPDILIAWEKDNKPLPPNKRYISLDSGVLFISTIEALDSGSYRCIATNPITKKQRISSEGQLTVVSRSINTTLPTFLSTITSLQILTGNNLTLECGATGWPPPKLTWLHDTQVPNKTFSIPGISILSVNSVTPDHAGNYTCSMASQSGIISRTVTVVVTVPPKFIKGPISQVFPTAKTVRFDCEVGGIPVPAIEWMKDGIPLRINGRIKQRATELVLSNTVTDDSGLYQCFATNIAGQRWMAGRLLVNASRYQPDPPHDLECFAKSASQVELTWEHGDSKQTESPIKAYTVHYLPSAGGEERQDVSVNKTVVVEKLTPFTNYTFYARAYSGRSASDQSARVICQTGEGAPQGTPTLSLDATSPTSLRVWWHPLTNEKARGYIIEYKIQWRRRSSPSSNVDQVKGDILEYLITGLHPGKKYEVRVLAATSQGWPDIPDEHLVWTSYEMPSHEPQSNLPSPVVYLAIINYTSIDVSWKLPVESKNRSLGFKLYYQHNGKTVGPINIEGNRTQYLLMGLAPDEWYEVHVLAWNSDGEGDHGVKSIHTLPDAATKIPNANRIASSLDPEPPTNLYAEPTSPTSINLTWIPPLHSQNISYYKICYSPVAASGQMSYANSKDNGVEIVHLKPYTLYEFKVQSHDYLEKHGNYSKIVECYTMEDLPGAVQDVQWKALNATAARVVWKAPDKTNGVIGAYLVTFSSDTAISHDQWRSQRVNGPKTSTDLEILPNVRYFLSVRAETKAGLGPPNAVPISLIIPSVSKVPQPPVSTPEPVTEQHLGITIGIVIIFACILLCGLIFALRRRCSQSAVPPGRGATNGNGCCRAATLVDGDLHELELLSHTYVDIQPVHIPPSNHAHLDTKGAGGYPNGQVNGLTNGRIPNGHRTSVHITENPQYNRKPLGTNNQEDHKPLLLPQQELGLANVTLASCGELDGETLNTSPGDWTQMTTLSLDDSQTQVT